MSLEKGEIIELDNGKEYICFSCLEDQNNRYIYLISNFKPLEIKFAKEIINNGEISLEIINQQSEKERLFKLFQEKNIFDK